MAIFRSIALVLFVALYSQAASAMLLGKSEHIRQLVDIPVKGPNGEALYLGYKLTFHNFLGGYNVTEDGHVIGVKGDSTRYFPMPMSDRIAAMQQAGMLPKPLPTYQLDTEDYIRGYWLWPALLLVLVWTALEIRSTRRGSLKLSESVVKTRTYIQQYAATPLSLPFTVKGRSLIPHANDLLMTDQGFAFASISGLNDVTHWVDINGFGLTNIGGKPFASWRYSQEFRGMSFDQVSQSTLGIGQSAPIHHFKTSQEELLGMLNATWLARRSVAPATQSSS